VFCRRGVVAIFRFLKSTALCVTLVAGFRPQVVVGFGSLASIPALLCAWGFRVPTLVHEQNVVPGRANLFLSAFVDKIAVSFPQSRPFFRAAGRKVVYTGNPLRRWLKAIDKSSARAFFHLQPSTFTVLVTGGSQGSQRINAVAQEALAQARQRAPLQVIHLTGQRDYQQIRKRYDAIMPDAVVVPFLGQMHYAYSAADLVIGRAGATTIAEIISFSLPAILIPYPFAHGHQEANARVLEKAGCALVVGDADLRRDDLSNKIGLCLQHGELLARMTESCRSLQSVNSAGLLVKAAMALAR
jgi:UDP-N-acetylglucosamine--N-acetylmuramyl-(pentapeptide) pyrophosphoryl-undecaprenol N-acetylglucosamine transferase